MEAAVGALEGKVIDRGGTALRFGKDVIDVEDRGLADLGETAIAAVAGVAFQDRFAERPGGGREAHGVAFWTAAAKTCATWAMSTRLSSSSRSWEVS